MTNITHNATTGFPAPRHIDPRADWPVEAQRLRGDLAAVYGAGDALVDVASGWVARWPSANTRRAYARGLRVWEACCRQRGVHPLAATASIPRLHPGQSSDGPLVRLVTMS